MKKTIFTAVLCGLCLPVFAAEDATLSFYQKQSLMKGDSSREDRAFASALARDTGLWIAAHEGNAEVKTALLMQADYYLRAREEAKALVALYQVRFYYPSAQDLTLLSSNVEQAMEGLDRSQKAQALKLLATDTSALTEKQKQTVLLETLVKGKLNKIYEPVCDLFERFFVANPDYADNDKLTLLYGDWHRQNGNYHAAVLEYKKVNELFAQTPYKAASLRMAADVYGGDLKDYETAVAIYNQVLKQYPDSAEKGIVYKHLAVMEENRKDYGAALAYYQRAITELGAKPAAYEAWTGKADVLIKNKEYQAAYDTQVKAAELFASNEEKYVSALTAAAETANRRLKDPAQQAAALDKILLVYPQTRTAPEVMYDLGYALEKQGKNSQAVATYKRLIINYPTDHYASRAQGRISRLEK
ncbi:MAG: tetratricopeptide repeat protein [Elusimicrobiaceae bacterium]|nr:tetratricopeptide repeat protein [Elusimicrobiaceae bacterium]